MTKKKWEMVTEIMNDQVDIISEVFHQQGNTNLDWVWEAFRRNNKLVSDLLANEIDFNETEVCVK